MSGPGGQAEGAQPPACPGGTEGHRLVLASQSPRRRELLARAGVGFEVARALVDDTHLKPGAVTPRQWASALAYLKAAGAARALSERGGSKPREVVLGADTVVVKGDELIGKAESAAEAERILRRLSDGEHEVVTGVALVEPGRAGGGAGRRRVFADTARVRVGRLSEAMIGEYVSSGQWRGKAGAYNLEERVSAGWPVEWVGDPTTVMGLPMVRLMPVLRAWGLAPPAGAVS